MVKRKDELADKTARTSDITTDSPQPPLSAELPPGSIIDEPPPVEPGIPVTITHGERGTARALECIINGVERVDIPPANEYATVIQPGDTITVQFKTGDRVIWKGKV